MTSNKNGLYAGLGVVALILVATAVFLSLNAPKPSSDDNSQPQTGLLRRGENVIYVADQPPGSNVNVSLVTLAASGFVVIHETDADGNPSQAIGASALLQAGEHNDVAIKTSRPLAAGKSYVAMLHADNGNGAYDNETIDAAVQENGGPVWMVFRVEAGASGSGVLNL